MMLCETPTESYLRDIFTVLVQAESKWRSKRLAPLSLPRLHCSHAEAASICSGLVSIYYVDENFPVTLQSIRKLHIVTKNIFTHSYQAASDAFQCLIFGKAIAKFVKIAAMQKVYPSGAHHASNECKKKREKGACSMKFVLSHCYHNARIYAVSSRLVR